MSSSLKTLTEEGSRASTSPTDLEAPNSVPHPAKHFHQSSHIPLPVRPMSTHHTSQASSAGEKACNISRTPTNPHPSMDFPNYSGMLGQSSTPPQLPTKASIMPTFGFDPFESTIKSEIYDAIDRKDWAAGPIAKTNDSTTNNPGSPRYSPDYSPFKAGGNVSSDEPPKWQRVIPQGTVPTIAGYASHFLLGQRPSDTTLANEVESNNPDEKVANWVAKREIPSPPPSDEELKVPALQVRKKSSQPSVLPVSPPALPSKAPQSSRSMPATKPSIPNSIDGTVPGPPEQEPISDSTWKGKQAVYQHALVLSPEEQQEELNAAFRLAMRQQFPDREFPAPKPAMVRSTTTSHDQLKKHPAQALSPTEQRAELHEALRLATDIWKKQLPDGEFPALEPAIVRSSTKSSHKQSQEPEDQGLCKAVRPAMQEQPTDDEDMCLSDTSEHIHSPSEHAHLPSGNSTLRDSSAPQKVDYRKLKINEEFKNRQQYAYETVSYQRRGNPKLKILDKRTLTTMNNPTRIIHPTNRVSSTATGSGSSSETLDAKSGGDSNGPYVGAHYMNSARSGRRYFRRSVSPKPKEKKDDERKDDEKKDEEKKSARWSLSSLLLSSFPKAKSKAEKKKDDEAQT